MSRKIYKLIEGQEAKNFKELAELLGVEKVLREDIAEGGQYADLVTVIDVTENENKDVDTKDSIEKEQIVEDKPEDTKKEDKKEDETIDKTHIVSYVKDEEVNVDPEQIVETLSKFDTLDSLKDAMRVIDTPTLEYMAKALKLEWTPTYHPAIHRMRISMSMQRYFFPELFKPKESSSKKSTYGDLSTQDLEKMAKKNKIDYTKTGNPPIDRMNLIMKLKESGHLSV